MFTLDEVKELRKSYQIEDNDNIIFNRINNKDNKNSVKSPSELSDEESMKIKSALFLYKMIKQEIFGLENLNEEQRLEKFQKDFEADAMANNTHSYRLMGNAIATIGKDNIWIKMLKNDPLAMNYFQYVLLENGKVAKNMEISGGTSGELTITYDIENKSRNAFIEQLNPDNPIYTQHEKSKELTPEQKARRRAFVEELISNYNKMEHEEWYQHRTEKEAINMQKVANIVNSHETMLAVKSGPGLLYLLKAAQNLSINGEKDFLEEIISQPVVNKTLLELKKSGQADKIRDEAMQNESNGRINSNGLLEGHSQTQGEKELHSANVCVRQNPNIVSEVRKTMQSSSTLSFDTSTDGIRLSNLYSLIARTQGKLPSKTRTINNIELNTDTEKTR